MSKRLGGITRLQIQNLFMAFKQVPRCRKHFYLLTFPRFPLRKKEHKSYFGKNRTHNFRTSKCAGYLLDHSGDELNLINQNHDVLVSSFTDNETCLYTPCFIISKTRYKYVVVLVYQIQLVARVVSSR